jgi:PAS domain S-box-containing protein
VHDEALVVRGRYGEADSLQGLMWDITEHKQAELAQQASEAKLRAIFVAMTDVLLVLDEQGHYLETAPTNPALLYRPAQNLFGRTLHEIFPSEKAEAFLGHLRCALEHNETVLTEYTLQLDHRQHCFSAAIAPMSDHKIVWAGRDITERRCTEKTL